MSFVAGMIADLAARQLAREAAEVAQREAARLAKELVHRAAVEALRGIELKATVELDLERFNALKKGVRVAVHRAANRAAKPLRGSVEAHARSISKYGFLSRSIGTKTRIYPSGGIATVVGPKMSFVRVKGKRKRGPKKGESIRHRPYLYSWLLERGTKRSRPRPFIKPSLDQLGAAYRADLAREIEAELLKLQG